jgi:hypothetical protein
VYVPEVWLVVALALISVIARSFEALFIANPPVGTTTDDARSAGTAVTFAVSVSLAEKALPLAVPVVSEVTAIRMSAPVESVVLFVTTVCDDVFSANDVATALAGATDVKTPKPKAATVTSAMRLKVVFVDICFLSISRVREFPDLGFG